MPRFLHDQRSYPIYVHILGSNARGVPIFTVERFVNEKVESIRYLTASEVLRDGLRFHTLLFSKNHFFDNFIGNVAIGFHGILPNLESDLVLLFPSLLKHITLSRLFADQTVEAAFEKIPRKDFP